MQVLGFVSGTGVSLSDVIDEVAEQLAASGRVAVVSSGSVEQTRTSVTLDEDAYRETGPGRDLGAVLDDLARDHAYALVEGFPDARLPTVVVGDAEARDQVLVVDDASDIDTADLVDLVAAQEPRESLASLVAAVKRTEAAEYSGAIATFTGRVRAKEHLEDDRTTSLTFEKYDGVAEQRLQALREELEARDGVLEVRLHHRTGTIPDGEDIVFVVVLAGHRREAFETVEDGIDRLKEEVPIFKKEVTVGEEFWVHDRP